MKTAIYLRKSRSDEVNSDDTLIKHKETLLDFAVKNDLIVTKIYEEVVSGESLFSRPQMLTLLSDMEQGLYDAVLCMDIDRLGRGDMQEQGLIMNRFKYSNTKIITPREVYNPENEKDEMFFEFKGIIARNELKAIKRRMDEGRKRTISQGGYIAEPPYGYVRAWDNKIPTLAINEEQAKIIRLIFDLYVNSGLGSVVIADTLHSMGLKTRKGTKFSRNTVRFILQNKTYIGKIQWDRNKYIRKKSPTDKHKRKITPEDSWIVVDGLHPPIISEELFYKANEIRKTRSHPPSNKGIIENPFAGIMKCEICGSLLQRQSLRKDYNSPILLCTTKGCCRSVRLDHMETAVYNKIQNFVEECELGATTTQRKRTTEITSIINALKKQCTTLEQQKESIHDLLEQKVYDIQTFMDRKNKLQDEIESITNRIKEQNNLITLESKRKTKHDLLPDAKNLLQNYWSSSPADKNYMLKTVIRKIIYSKTKQQWDKDFFITIEYNYDII